VRVRHDELFVAQCPSARAPSSPNGPRSRGGSDHPIPVDGAAATFAHPHAESEDHDLGQRFAARPLPLPAVHVGQTQGFQFDGFRRGWVAQFDRAALLQTPAFANAKVFVGAGFHSTTVYALDAENGTLRWVGETPDGGPTAALVDDDKVLFNTESCTLFAFDVRSGRQLWSHYLGDPVAFQPAVANGWVYASTARGKVIGLE
jgi:Ca-activated chloride channel family protein